MPMTMFGLSAGFPASRPRLLPAPLEREPTEHRRLARAGGRASGRLVGIGRVPETAEDVDAPHLDLGGLRVLVLVDHVLVEALGHQPLGLRLHPGADERRDVEARVAVEHQLVVDDLVRDVSGKFVGRELVPRDACRLEREHRVPLDRGAARMLQRHRLSLRSATAGTDGARPGPAGRCRSSIPAPRSKRLRDRGAAPRRPGATRR